MTTLAMLAREVIAAVKTDSDPLRAELYDYLQAVSDDGIYWLVALMYCGRENAPDLAAMRSYVAGMLGDAEVGQLVLCEKRPVADYLTRGLALCPLAETIT